MATKKAKEEDILKTLMTKLKPAMIRFVYLYLGAEDGKCFNNATLSYLRAYDIDTVTTKVKQENGIEDYTSAYKSAKSKGYDLLTKPDIQRFKHYVLLQQGYSPDNIKKRFAELSQQNKNLPIALTATDRMAKIAGVIKEDSKSVDIPQLTELTDHIKKILSQ